MQRRKRSEKHTPPATPATLLIPRSVDYSGGSRRRIGSKGGDLFTASQFSMNILEYCNTIVPDVPLRMVTFSET